MKLIAELGNRIYRDAWLKEHGGKAVKEDNVWYWIAPEEPKVAAKPKVAAEPKKGKKKLF